jgi:secreted PhoX family phosphatase
MVISRRQLLKGSASGLGLLVAGQSGMLRLAMPAFGAPTADRAFGPLRPDPAGLLDLPAGFRYDIVTQAGRPLAGGDGAAGLTPGRPDGTAAFAGILAKTYLVQNHEQGSSADFPATADARFTYDPGAVGGTTTLRLDHRNRLEESYVSLAGTFNNCAGGPTPWSTWLTCEETEVKAGGALTKDHGWVFEVSPWFPIVNRDPEPLIALGRFPHEAVTIDPLRGHVYLTEDASNPNGLLYRFTPNAWPGRIHSLREGGTLEAMRVAGVADLSTVSAVGTTLPVTWVPVPDPLAATTSTRKQFTYQAFPGGATVPGAGGDVTRSRKFEGAWWGRGQAFIVCSFARGAADWSEGAHDGQVWSYDPGRAQLRLEAYFPRNLDPSGAGADQPDGPDNITVGPYGGLLVAEDGEGPQHLVAIADDGMPSLFARNALSGSEFTGVTFAPDRQTLFANIQDEGYTFAISGPFARFRG